MRLYNHRWLLALWILASSATLLAQSLSQRPVRGLIPYPAHVSTQEGVYTLTQELSIAITQGAHDLLFPMLREQLHETGHRATLSSLDQASEIVLALVAPPNGNTSSQGEAEAYRLSIGSSGIRLTAQHRKGLQHGVMTLLQLLDAYAYPPTGEIRLPLLEINDAPRLETRALMLDPARHFLPLADLKGFVDQMIRYKYNTLQLHLTDDQGWRIEIPSYPQLTRLGTERAPADAHSPNRAYYTLQELGDLVAYASERGVEIIPEIDIPGHTGALLVAHPELRCDIARDSSWRLGREQVMLSATNEGVYRLLEEVAAQLASVLPPGSRLHLGGDESAIEHNWAISPEHKALMSRLGLRNPREIMGYFFGRVLPLVRQYGLRPMLWCELDNIRLPANQYLFAYPEDVELISWRFGLTPKCLELTRLSGHRIILAPGESSYLDYPQYRRDLPEHRNWGMPTTMLSDSYNFDLRQDLYSAGDSHISGVMATLWGEAIQHIDRAYYMCYPRALAIAEVGWTPLEGRSWEGFTSALPSVLMRLMRAGKAFRTPAEIYR